MKKEDLRPITYDNRYLKKGYFHQWITKKDEDGSDFIMALVETAEGTIKEVHAASIKFVD